MRELVASGSAEGRMQTFTAVGRLRKGAPMTQTAQTPLDPKTWKGRQKTLEREFLRGQISGKRLEKLNIDPLQ